MPNISPAYTDNKGFARGKWAWKWAKVAINKAGKGLGIYKCDLGAVDRGQKVLQIGLDRSCFIMLQSPP